MVNWGVDSTPIDSYMCRHVFANCVSSKTLLLRKKQIFAINSVLFLTFFLYFDEQDYLMDKVGLWKMQLVV